VILKNSNNIDFDVAPLSNEVQKAPDVIVEEPLLTKLRLYNPYLQAEIGDLQESMKELGVPNEVDVVETLPLGRRQVTLCCID
jgi:hypothetical protein